MKAMTLWQPWASLMAEGIKTIETRPLPHPWRSAVGERVAIHAGLVFASVCPDGGTCHHRCTPSRGPERSGCYRVDCCGPLSGTIGQGPDEDYWPEFPRGAVLATGLLVDVVPMVHTGEEGAIRTLDCDPGGPLWIVEAQRYPLLKDVDDEIRNRYLNEIDDPTDPAEWEDYCDACNLTEPPEHREVTEQRPYGNFEPGRWALLFDDLVKLEEPVPARGRQGLWTWDEVAA